MGYFSTLPIKIKYSWLTLSPAVRTKKRDVECFRKCKTYKTAKYLQTAKQKEVNENDANLQALVSGS